MLTLISMPVRVRGGSVSARDAGTVNFGFPESVSGWVKRFHNLCALAGVEQGAFFLRKKALSCSGFEA